MPLSDYIADNSGCTNIHAGLRQTAERTIVDTSDQASEPTATYHSVSNGQDEVSSLVFPDELHRRLNRVV